jgi:Tfp pilus assembly protein PilX
MIEYSKQPFLSDMNNQRGISLIITFLIMSVMLAIVLSISSLTMRQLRLVSDVGNGITAFNAAESGWEKTQYLDRKQIPARALRGLCSICVTCPSRDCKTCQMIALLANGCTPENCSNCKISYNSSMGEASYAVEAMVRAGKTTIFSEGSYRGVFRVLNK